MGDVPHYTRILLRVAFDLSYYKRLFKHAVLVGWLLAVRFGAVILAPDRLPMDFLLT
jgi:hypothetical protein